MGAPDDDALIQRVMAVGAQVRYVAVARGQDVRTTQRAGVAAPSESGSDFYEELLVNPTLLTLARQRGELDCGGLRHLVIAYGNFSQVVLALPDGTGHLSVCVESESDTDAVAEQLAGILRSA